MLIEKNMDGSVIEAQRTHLLLYKFFLVCTLIYFTKNELLCQTCLFFNDFEFCWAVDIWINYTWLFEANFENSHKSHIV